MEHSGHVKTPGLLVHSTVVTWTDHLQQELLEMQSLSRRRLFFSSPDEGTAPTRLPKASSSLNGISFFSPDSS